MHQGHSIIDSPKTTESLFVLSQTETRSTYSSYDQNPMHPFKDQSTHRFSVPISSISNSRNTNTTAHSMTGSVMKSLTSTEFIRPLGFTGRQLGPVPRTMLSKFSSRPSGPKRNHRCKLCEKSFVRPSSLQTHLYSHTGEKRKPGSIIPLLWFPRI